MDTCTNNNAAFVDCSQGVDNELADRGKDNRGFQRLGGSSSEPPAHFAPSFKASC